MDLPPNPHPNPASPTLAVERISVEQLAAAARLRQYWMQRCFARSRFAAPETDKGDPHLLASRPNISRVQAEPVWPRQQDCGTSQPPLAPEASLSALGEQQQKSAEGTGLVGQSTSRLSTNANPSYA